MATYESKRYAIIPINADQIADGTVSNSEFQTVDTTSSINTQLGTKVPLAGGTMTGAIQLNDATLNVYTASASAIIGKIGQTANDINIFSTTTGHNGLRMHANGILPTDNTGTIINNDADLGDPNYVFKDLYLGGFSKADYNQFYQNRMLSKFFYKLTNHLSKRYHIYLVFLNKFYSIFQLRFFLDAYYIHIGSCL